MGDSDKGLVAHVPQACNVPRPIVVGNKPASTGLGLIDGVGLADMFAITGSLAWTLPCRVTLQRLEDLGDFAGLWRRRRNRRPEHAALISTDSSGTCTLTRRDPAGVTWGHPLLGDPHNLFCNHLDDRAVSAEVLVIQICDQRRAT